jgi:hypothetical protein
MDYFKVNRIDNSALSTINPEQGGCPQKYKDFVSGVTESSDAFTLGDIIHRKFLLNEEFAVITTYPSAIIQEIIDAYYKELSSEMFGGTLEIDDNTKLLLSIAREKGYQANYKDETLINAVIKNGKAYFDNLVLANGKTAISSEVNLLLDKIALSLNTSVIQSIINPQGEGIEILSEEEIFFDIKASGYFDPSVTYNCKAKIDRLILNHKTKTFKIIDLKSTSKLIDNFEISVENYKYYRQLAFYKRAVETNYPEYTCDGLYLLAVETNNYCRARVFMLDEAVVQKGTTEFLSLLKRIDYHNQTNNWVYPMEHESNGGIYLLKTVEHESNTLSQV